MLTVVCLAAFVWSSHTSPFIPRWRETALYQSGLLDCLLPICTLLFVREIRDKMQVVYREITRDGVYCGKIEFDWWNTIQASEKLPNVHVVQ